MVLSKRKKEEGIYCCAYNCTEKPQKKKGGLCHKHYKRKRREIDPVYVRYNGFCWKSKKRGLENSVTLEQFRRFCNDNKYIANLENKPFKGRRGQNATIDRRCSIHGYHIWNMQILSNRANASKGNTVGEDFTCPF